MEFFELFFTGEYWCWRLIGLLMLISTVGHYMVEVLNTYLTYRLAVKLGVNFNELIEDEESNDSATIDDCR